MTSDRVLKLFAIATVLGAAWYADAEDSPGMAIPVTIVGLGAAYWRAMLGITVALVMAAAAIYLPGVAIAAAFVVVFLAIVVAYVNATLRHGPIRSTRANASDG